MIQPIKIIAYQHQKEKGGVNLSSIQSTKSDVCSSQICIDSTIELMHTESNTSYTLISVPKESIDIMNQCNHNYVFLFALNEKYDSVIPVLSNISFIFSRFLLTHWQHCVFHNDKNILFYNFASYANTCLFTHVQATFIRNININ